MALNAAVFDVGETLVDETALWERAADAAGVPRFTLMALVGAAIARGASHRAAFEWLGVGVPRTALADDRFYPDALPCLERLRAAGYLVGAFGNMAIAHEALVAPHVDVVASSERWGVEKPSPAFFERLVTEVGHDASTIAYVGDRVDNDVEPALAAGLVAVHIRRGPWGHLHKPPPAAVHIRSLDELPEAFSRA
jgi:HAD superfamily hydrolase (TIGR01549 family)